MQRDVWTYGQAPGPCLVRGALVAIVAGLLVACRSTRPATDSAPEAQYRAAIEDARTAEPSEITTGLTPLVPYNDSLVWRTVRDSTRQVLVVTWGGSETLPRAAAGDTVTADRDVWVTAVPTIRQFCRGLDREGDALQRRLAQRLGLPPDADYDRFVELWVRPQALVRPCPDPEVTDRECELRAPEPAGHVVISDAHRDWFLELRQTSYGPDGYPFTGLGYTYDWNPQTDEVGPSEFVLRPGEAGIVRATYSTAAYCRVAD
ncbi:MAG: hypothetical protein V5A20_07475 [Salinibacter sp.]|uniref:hypothetical protein n=1 Tax=Salinibacter sp. TaxID=2065818 RepID=UPI002FC2D1B7